jgi:hypothetical protein
MTWLIIKLSIKTEVDPQSLSSMLGIATRLAQRMGLHLESAHAKYPPFEAEMRRRLWWSIVLFDARVCETILDKTGMLTPLWDCKIPLNISDFGLQPEMKEPPVAEDNATEAIFAVVRGELGDFIRHNHTHLEFLNPALKLIAKNHATFDSSPDVHLSNEEKLIEEKYLKFCNTDNPLHFMTINTARGYLAKVNLLKNYTRTGTSQQQIKPQRDDVISYALKILNCDTQLMTSPLTKGFIWYTELYFPFPAHFELIQDLKRNPGSGQVAQLWETIDANYISRLQWRKSSINTLYRMLGKPLLQAWSACEASAEKSGNQIKLPQIIFDIKERLAQSRDAANVNLDQPNDRVNNEFDFSMSLPIDLTDTDSLFGMERHIYTPGIAFTMPTQPPINRLFNGMGWGPPMNLNPMQGSGW